MISTDIFEIDRAALRVRQAAIVHDLQQDVEDIGMRLLDFIEQHDRIRPTTNGFGQLAAFVVADISRRRADQASDCVFFHVLAHVDADHGLLVIEQELSQRASGLRFADAGWPKEDKAADRLLRILTDRRGNGEWRWPR